MNEAHIQKIAGELKIQPRQVLATAKLFAEGATVPFISRYRKEATGSLDEVAVTNIRERLIGLADLDSRRETILKSLVERNLLTDSLKAAIAAADNVTRLEDIYLPYRPKRRTRAMIAKEQGLEPLANVRHCNFIERAGGFFAVAGNKWNCRALGEQFGRSQDLARLNF